MDRDSATWCNSLCYYIHYTQSLHDHKHDLQALVTKSSERQVETMNEMKLFRDRLRSFGRDITYSSREVLQPGSITRKESMIPLTIHALMKPIFGIVDDDQPAKLDVEELENLLYEERSIPINEVEGSSSHIDDEDGGDVAIERLDVENFGFPDAHFQSLDSNFQNE
ncbi:hypothetical protein CK203_030582 [Vitis vinifera]|uniref:Uncharacterized protein n=1 Tax=Vitis vinifera TaxID=29760 RepID=A0A438JDR7_VITVI|nr:hypothetical protein CK203_030582 [Vitis vinifera]